MGELNEKVDVARLRIEAILQNFGIMRGKIFSASCKPTHYLGHLLWQTLKR